MYYKGRNFLFISVNLNCLSQHSLHQTVVIVQGHTRKINTPVLQARLADALSQQPSWPCIFGLLLVIQHCATLFLFN